MLQPNNQKREAMSIFNIIIVTLLVHLPKHASLSLARVWILVLANVSDTVQLDRR